jgi:hypothetical protein
MTDYKEVRTTEHEQGREQRAATFKATQMIWLLWGLLEAVLALRVIFKLIGVNAANPFAALLYSFTGFVVAPFASLARAPAAGGMVLEISSIIAMIVYLLIAWGIATAIFVVLFIWRSVLSSHEDDQIFLDAAEEHMAKEQRELVAKITSLSRPLIITGVLSGALLLIAGGLWIYEGLKQNF